MWWRERGGLNDWKCGDLQHDHEMATPMQPNFRRWLHRKMNGWGAGYITRGGAVPPACVGAAVCFVSMETILAWVQFQFHPGSSETWQCVLMIFIVTTVPL